MVFAIPRFAILFQFTPLREGRQKHLKNFFVYYLISIHAPPRGATWVELSIVVFLSNFNSRPSARGDGADLLHPRALPDFNSRPSARGDRDYQFREAAKIFQFTPLREGRQRLRKHIRQLCISIHAPPRGATAKDMQFLQIFCSTLTNQHGLTIVPRNLSRLFW